MRARRAEIEQAVLTRAFAVSDTNEPVDLGSLDPEYLQGLRTAISAAVDYGLAVIESGEQRAPSPPPVLLAQARLAARFNIGLDTVLRRYAAGYILLLDFLIEEAEPSGLRGAALKRLMRAQAALDRLLAAVSEEYAREERERASSSEQRRAERIERLLAGELLDTSGLAYEFECTHLGAIASGEGAEEALRDLASTFGCRLLTVRGGEGTVWAWFGSRQAHNMCDLHRYAQEAWPKGVKVAIGEQGEGLAGWRLSHRQARAALPIALRSSEPFVRYVDVALLAAVLQDDLLATSLRKAYLAPLENERDGGEVARETLRAYFAAESNVSSAAAALGVKRHTVTNRLRAIEERLGRSLSTCSPELEAALRLEQLESPA
ncbi:MAG TPA: helix-turn-helix domain-containing protein [Solirubrobacterales bacterium]